MRFARRALQRLVRTIVLLIGGTVGATAIALLLVMLGTQLAGLRESVAFSSVEIPKFTPLSERSRVFDRYGNEMAVLVSDENRTQIKIDKVPRQLINAIIDTEDAAFYKHQGINARATVRALWANVEAGGVAQGGSTITQQLVKKSFLTDDRNVGRKLREARLALELERRWSKTQILERYLNTVYFGQGAYGVQAAAERYFKRNVEDLDVPQSAFLAGMIRNPSGYDPVKFPERARSRRAVVLERMVAEKHLTRDEANRYKTVLLPKPANRLRQPDTYFIEDVKQHLLDDPRLGKTYRQRYEMVFNGGLRIETTLDPDFQRTAEAVVRDTLSPTGKPEFTAALVSIETNTGAVRAMVGGRGFLTDKYNLATQGTRQPGSSWKPFTLAAAIENGISPESIINGLEPCRIPNPGGRPDPYIPGNYEGSKGRVGSLVEQITISNNCAYARLASIIGLDKVISVARRLGITTQLDPVPAMALGTEEVHPIEMAGAYATFGADGVFHAPYLVERVLDRNDNVIFQADREGRRALSTQTARQVVAALETVVDSGTGTKAALRGRDVAGKTGTAQDYEDAWFVGFTPEYSTAVWMGDPLAKTPMRNVGGVRVTGGSYPAMIWRSYMSKVLDGIPAGDFIAPDERMDGRSTCLSLPASSRSGSGSSRSGRSVAKTSGRGFAVGMQETPVPVQAARTVRRVEGGSEGDSSSSGASRSSSKRSSSKKASSKSSSKSSAKRSTARTSSGCSVTGGTGSSSSSSNSSSSARSSSSSSRSGSSAKKAVTKRRTATTKARARKRLRARVQVESGGSSSPEPVPVQVPAAEPAPAPEPVSEPAPDPPPSPDLGAAPVP